jgi:hypothetical protein
LVATLRLSALWLALTLVLRVIAPMPTRDEGRIEVSETTDKPI